MINGGDGDFPENGFCWGSNVRGRPLGCSPCGHPIVDGCGPCFGREQKWARMKQRIEVLKERNQHLRRNLKGDKKNIENGKDISSSSPSSESSSESSDDDVRAHSMKTCQKRMQRRIMRHMMAARGPWAHPGMFFKCGFGPRGYFWKHVIHTGPIQGQNIRAHLETVADGYTVIVEGKQNDVVDGVPDGVHVRDSFKRTVVLPASVDEQKVRVIYRNRLGGCVVVRAPRRCEKIKKHGKKEPEVGEECCEALCGGITDDCVDLDETSQCPSVCGSLNHAMELMQLEVSDNYDGDVQPADACKERKLPVSSGCDDDFEIVVKTQNVPQDNQEKIVVKKLTEALKSELKGNHFHKKVSSGRLIQINLHRVIKPEDELIIIICS